VARRALRTDALAGGTRADANARQDGPGAAWVNPMSGQGSAMDRQAWTTYAGGCPLSWVEINDLMRTVAPARRLAEQPGLDSMRMGYQLKGMLSGQALNVQIGGPPTQKDEPADPIASWAQGFGVLRHVLEADTQSRAHGLALWVVGVEDGVPSDQPLNWPGITRLAWVRTVTRERASVMAWDDDPSSSRFMLPKLYQVSLGRGGSHVFHWSRVWAWDGVPLSFEERELSADHGGGSVFDLVWSELRSMGVSQALAVEALTRLSQAVWQNDNLAQAVDGGNANAAAEHYERVASGGGSFGDYLIGRGESYQVIGRPIAGMSEVMERLRDAWVTATPMPEVVALGLRPSTSGLGDDADGEIRAWYDYLAGDQPNRYGPPLSYLYRIASRAANGPTAGVPIMGLEVGWPSLWQLTDKERAEVRKLNADARAVDLAAAVISVGEARSDQTLIDEYELAPEGVATVEPEPEVAIEEIDIADDGLMPAGESPIGLLAAAAIIGRRSPGAARNFIAANNVPLFKPGANYAVFESHLRAAMRESQVI